MVVTVVVVGLAGGAVGLAALGFGVEVVYGTRAGGCSDSGSDAV